MPRTIELIRVKTSAGERVYPLGTRVYTNISGKDVYLRKYAGDVSEGEMLLWHNEAIETTLPEIENDLRKSQRYRKAEEAVFATNSRGEKIPWLRVELIRALAAKSIINADSNESLEQKIMREEGDFTSPEYGQMQSYLHSQITEIAAEDSTLQRAKSTIDGWLHGTIASPQIPEIFYAIALATGSKTFEEWWSHAGERGGYWGNYRLYNIIRRGITSYLARKQGGLTARTGKSEGREGNEHISIMPEAQIILNQLMQEISDEFSLARVRSTEIISVDAKTFRIEKENYLGLSKGAYTGDAMENTVLLNLREIATEHNFFGYILQCLVEGYFDERASERYPPEDADKKIAALRLLPQKDSQGYDYLIGATINSAIRKLGLVNSYAAEAPIETALGLGEFADEIAETLADRVMSAEVDKTLGIESHTAYGLFELYAKLGNSMPKVYRDWKANLASVNAPRNLLLKEKRREAELQDRKLKGKIASRYGWDGMDIKIFLLPEMRRYFDYYFKSQLPPRPEVFAREHPEEWQAMWEGHAEFMLGFNSPGTMRNDQSAHTIYEEVKETVFTRQECYKILEKYGLQALKKVVPEANFTFEPQPASKRSFWSRFFRR